MLPVVLVLSYGSTKPEEIIKNICADYVENNEKAEEISIGTAVFQGNTFVVKNKYFQTNILFVPIEGHIEAVPEDLIKKTEALIVLFDSQDNDFFKEIKQLRDVVENNNIELSMLITNKFLDDTGLTYGAIKNECQTLFDVIELDCDESDDEENENSENKDKEKLLQFDEVIEALNNHLWSNVDYPGSNSKHTNLPHDPDMEERELEAFDNLLSSIAQFKLTAASLERDELLDQAEKLAEKFVDLLNDD